MALAVGISSNVFPSLLLFFFGSQSPGYQAPLIFIKAFKSLPPKPCIISIFPPRTVRRTVTPSLARKMPSSILHSSPRERCPYPPKRVRFSHCEYRNSAEISKCQSLSFFRLPPPHSLNLLARFSHSSPFFCPQNASILCRASLAQSTTKSSMIVSLPKDSNITILGNISLPGRPA